MTNYIMPTSADLPPIRVFFEELAIRVWRVWREGNRRAADGRAGAGDPERDCSTRLGMPFDAIPLLPEDIFDAMLCGAHSECERRWRP